ncbi:MAG: hypothetical protein ACO1OB_14765 [Archangium sp.]
MKATLALLLLAGATSEGPEKTPEKPAKPSLYTTYFYTAGEAIVHGYEDGTKVRVVSMSKRGTIWEGTVKAGETRLVQTGQGVFGFMADKKATILVGTPSSCTVVGYFFKDENGSFKSTHFYGQLPNNAGPREHFTIWAYDASFVKVLVDGKEVKSLELPAGGFYDFHDNELQKLAGRTVEIKATNKGVAAQVYYDEGFMVPADNGRGSGKRFMTYVGMETTGENDLNVLAQGLDAKIKVRNLKTNATIFEGVVKKGSLKTLTLKDVFVEVTSDVPVNAVVAAFDHYKGGYAEHHFQTGLEGAGIENDFLMTTSGELWVFSYFSDNAITVEDAKTGRQIFKGTANAGQVHGLTPGFGLYRVKGSKGLSVMGGASTCVADFSPAGSMFAVDEALFHVVAQVRDERIKAAEATGRKLSEKELNAPMTRQEYDKYAPAPAAASPTKSLSLDEANERAAQFNQ